MKILFPVDGSRISNETAQALASRPWPEGTIVKVVTVVPSSLRDAIDHVKHDELIYAQQNALARLVCHLKEKLPHCFFLTAVYDGHVVDEIIAEADAWPCDLIAMASHDRRGLERVLLGSVSHAVSMRAACPVLIVKPNQHRQQCAQRIIVAIDHSECSVEAMRWVARSPWGRNTEIVLLSVADTRLERYSAETSVYRAADMLIAWQSKQSKLTSLLNSLAVKLKSITGIESVTIRLVNGDPRQAIVEEADSWNADLIVMGSHGRTGLSKVLMGSVAQAVLSHAHCSVEIVKTDRTDSGTGSGGGRKLNINPRDQGISETHAFPAGLV